MSVRSIAIPGALAQISVATVLGLGLSTGLGWSLGSGLVFGLALSVASTVVLLRALEERRLLYSDRGRIAVGWLIVEDVVMVLALVLLPAIAPLFTPEVAAAPRLADILFEGAITIVQVAAFVAVMLLVGRRLIPAVLHYIAGTGSRELFRLGVLAIALGVAFAAAKLFGASFALGAFFAGMILSESEFSQRAAEESLPLRDAFAVLFFVSVGMLFNPAILVTETWPVLATVAIIVLGKSLAALAIMMVFGYPLMTALLVSASLAQIGEFSFILVGLGVALELISESGRDLVLASALISILLNPLLFRILDRYQAAAETGVPGRSIAPAVRAEHRVGAGVAAQLIANGSTLLVIDERHEAIERARAHNIDAVTASAPPALDMANLAAAKALVVTVPDVFESGQIVEQARAKNPSLLIVAACNSDADAEYLLKRGATSIVRGAEETARAIVDEVLSTGRER